MPDTPIDIMADARARQPDVFGNPAASQFDISNYKPRNADPIVSRAALTEDNTGPQSKQEIDKFSFDNSLRFPPGIGEKGDTPNRLHWIKFTPCIQIASQYQLKDLDAYAGVSDADANRNVRGADGNILPGAGSSEAVSNIGGITAGLATLSTAEAAASGAGELWNANVELPANLTKAGVKAALVQAAAKIGLKAASKALVGAVSAGFAGGVAAAVNLSRKTRKAKAAICLYMPDTVNQQMVNQYEPVSLTQALGRAGLVGAVGSSIVGTVMGADEDTIKAGLGGGGVGGEAGGLAEVAGTIAEKTGNFGQGITDVLLFSAGLAQNPQVELLFKTISNREFMFDFKFVPRSQSEAETIRKIIKTFRFYAAPEIPTSGKGRYFIPPAEFDIEFCLGQARNTNLPKISTCVLEGIDVNYGSAGQWTAFKDGMPVEISMQLRFKEVEIIHKGLIEKGY